MKIEDRTTVNVNESLIQDALDDFRKADKPETDLYGADYRKLQEDLLLGWIEQHHDTMIRNLERMQKLEPLLWELIKSKRELADKATFKHGDSMDDYYNSEAFLMSFAEEAKNITSKIAKILTNGGENV